MERTEYMRKRTALESQIQQLQYLHGRSTTMYDKPKILFKIRELEYELETLDRGFHNQQIDS